MYNNTNKKIESAERQYAVALMKKLDLVSDEVKKNGEKNIEIDFSPITEAITNLKAPLQELLVESKKKESEALHFEISDELRAELKGDPGDVAEIDYEKILSLIKLPETEKVDYAKILSGIEMPEQKPSETLNAEDIKNIVLKRLEGLSESNMEKYVEDDDFIRAIIRRLPGKKAYSTAIGAKNLIDLEDVNLEGLEKDEDEKYILGSGGIAWVDAPVSVDLESGKGYSVSGGSMVELRLPTDCSLGDRFDVAGFGSGGWRIRTRGGQTLYSAEYGDVSGASAGLESDDQYSSVTVLCRDANTFTIIDNHGGASPVTVTVDYEFQDDTNYQFMDGINYDFVI